MNISLLTRLTGLLLVAGFFYSCTTTQTNINQLVESNNYEQAMAAINQQLENNPDQPELYILKGEVAAEMAQDESPEARSDYYQTTDQAFGNALSYGADPMQQARIDSLRQQYWKFEHNAGLRIFENQTITDRYQVASIHFENAIILRDDALSSYKNLAITHYERGNIDEAIQYFNRAKNLSDEDIPAEIFENLGYLYLEKGDPDQAIYYYELANQQVTENFNLAFGLINAYISSGDHEGAVELLEPLVEQNPNNADLRNVYGTQLYEITEEIMQDLREAYQQDNSELVQQIRFEAEGMGEQAENQLVEAFKRDTSSTDYIESLAVFYNNLAAQYFSLTKVAYEDHVQDLNLKGLELADFAIRYYSMLNDIDPQNDEYQTKLTTLETIKENRSSTE